MERSLYKSQRTKIRNLERSMIKTKRDKMLASRYEERQTNLKRDQETTTKVEEELDDLFKVLADNSGQVDIDDLIVYINSLGSQYRNSIILKILRIYQVTQNKY